MRYVICLIVYLIVMYGVYQYFLYLQEKGKPTDKKESIIDKHKKLISDEHQQLKGHKKFMAETKKFLK